MRFKRKYKVANKVIFKYLKSDPSWPLFVKNVKERHSEDPKIALKFLLGACGESTYDRALYWRITPEGHDYWEEKQNKLYRWSKDNSKLIRSNYKYL